MSIVNKLLIKDGKPIVAKELTDYQLLRLYKKIDDHSLEREIIIRLFSELIKQKEVER